MNTLIARWGSLRTWQKGYLQGAGIFTGFMAFFTLMIWRMGPPPDMTETVLPAHLSRIATFFGLVLAYVFMAFAAWRSSNPEAVPQQILTIGKILASKIGIKFSVGMTIVCLLILTLNVTMAPTPIAIAAVSILTFLLVITAIGWLTYSHLDAREDDQVGAITTGVMLLMFMAAAIGITWMLYIVALFIR